MDDTYEKNERSKYENRIIKKHFINCAKSNKIHSQRKLSTNSQNTHACRHFHGPKRFERQRELSNYRNDKNLFSINEIFIPLPKYNPNYFQVSEDNDNDNHNDNHNNIDAWQCDVCTFLNVDSSLYCAMCNNYNPLCSSNNITINQYINTNINDNGNENENDNLSCIKHEYDQTTNIYNYDEDDFNNNIQNVLLQSIDINNENSNDNNDNNIEFMATEEKKKDVITFVDSKSILKKHKKKNII